MASDIIERYKASAWHQLCLALLPFTHAISKSINADSLNSNFLQLRSRSGGRPQRAVHRTNWISRWEQSGLIYPKLSHTAAVWLAWKSATRRPQSAAPGSREQPTWPVLPAKHQYFTTDECLAKRKVFENYFRLAYLHITISVLIRYNTRLDIRNGTSEIPTLTHADRHINVSFMKISYSQGADN